MHYIWNIAFSYSPPPFEYSIQNNIAGFDCRRDAMHGISTSVTPERDEGLFQKGMNKLESQRKDFG